MGDNNVDAIEKPGQKLNIAIVATVRNEAATIAAFVDSLLRQDYQPTEIIIVDGASTDGTMEILDEYRRNGTIKLLSQDCNIAQGRNIGVKAARSAYIAVTDAGCEVEETWLLGIVKCFLADDKVAVVAGNFAFHCVNDFERAVVSATFSPQREQSDAAKFYPSSRSLAFTKAAWEKAGGYPEWLYAAEDTLFNIRLRQLGLEFSFCKAAVVRWRPRETWRALAKQRVNFARGNARVGIGKQGYMVNLKYHGMILAALLLALFWAPFGIVAAALVFQHVRVNLWKQSLHAYARTGSRIMQARVIAVMEFVRLVNLWGYFLGEWDRATDPMYKRCQREWMGEETVEALLQSWAEQEKQNHNDG